VREYSGASTDGYRQLHSKSLLILALEAQVFVQSDKPEGHEQSPGVTVWIPKTFLPGQPASQLANRTTPTTINTAINATIKNLLFFIKSPLVVFPTVFFQHSYECCEYSKLSINYWKIPNILTSLLTIYPKLDFLSRENMPFLFFIKAKIRVWISG